MQSYNAQDYDYVNGHVERKQGGRYEGNLTIDGVNISPIVGVYFDKDGSKYLWLKRKKIKEYDFNTHTYKEREARPFWEVYLKKEMGSDSIIAYRGEFIFLHFKYSIIGIWDKILGKEKQRLNLFVERLPMAQQTIINSINEINKQ